MHKCKLILIGCVTIHGLTDCTPIKPDGPCFEPNNLRSHASFVLNRYYQINGRIEEVCYFRNSSITVFKDPSYGDCQY
ncbi:hypothetical protein DY000_02026026 [Brassica cretica]|uniref:X8 domain-containing protein n=1 Tax=Brassica cretica TaxID=69181 RepID=A0ABQ7EGR6_BRACR|nr:hypothetical protein DY000_02026026 [Brassica cretica]